MFAKREHHPPANDTATSLSKGPKAARNNRFAPELEGQWSSQNTVAEASSREPFAKIMFHNFPGWQVLGVGKLRSMTFLPAVGCGQ